MPRIRCVVNLKLRAVRAPGVYFMSREDVYLSVSLFGQNKSTRLQIADFPMYIQQDLLFDKTYYTSLLSSEALDRLRDELVVVELVQLSRYGSSVRLASYSTSARDFLFPIPSRSLYHSSSVREIPLRRLIDFPGENPIWLEFSTVTDMTESLLPEADNILYRPTLRDSLLYKPTLSDRYGLRPFTAIERLDLERTERALQRSKSMEKLELDHLRALQKSRELAKLEQELETKRRERLAREQLEDSLRRSRTQYLEDLELDKLRMSRRYLYL
ncbi:spermatogenesis-associated protein 6-like [Ostrea edulis]|uniref:spermatogenesis-associated protein 6-like n=1 Tax=Ostrea edulis TaxID=37623 RepID=UPI0024AF6121|nr:spermatogenesis-associated protein 6-like [Ostrea edulis]